MDICELYTQGKSITEIAKIVNLSTPTVRKRLLKTGVTLRTYSEVLVARSKQDSRLQDYDFMYDARIKKQMSVEKIAALLGTTFKYVKASLLNLGIPYKRMNESLHYQTITKNQLVDLYGNNTYNQIASILNCSQATIHRFFEKYGIQAKKSNDYPQVANNFKSTQEIVITDWLISLGLEIITDYRIDGVSYDIYIPAKNLAIEYNGIYWHSDKFKRKDLHQDKTNKAEANGFRLFHVWEDDWRDHQKIVRSMIINAIGMTTDRISGRDCVVGIIDPSIAKQFYNDNHIQQFASAKVHVGLTDNSGRLVFAASFRKPRFTNKYQWELIRMASVINTNVRGGVSRVLKYFRAKNPGTIVSYADRTYSAGNVYKSMGFVLTHTNPISYWYVINGKRVPRTLFTKKSLPDSPYSEKTTADIIGLPRIWNSGIQTWVLK